jgi:phospholipase C
LHAAQNTPEYIFINLTGCTRNVWALSISSGGMDTRRTFIKNAALLTGGAGLLNILPPSIQRALAIDPLPGSTYLDAEHIVILMQENRSFDHTLGTLRGVRGFNDPRAIALPNKNAVWLQGNADGETYAPFRLDIKATQSTWMGGLPHGWESQVDAANGGKHDNWLTAKQTEEWSKMPLTMGYYDRHDIPFYYSLADTFTVCDQNFCSSLTGTTPNRLHLWSGTAGGKADENSYANTQHLGYSNRTMPDINPNNEASWLTFPELLEDNGISWRIYQNELSIPTGLSKEEDGWLGNFTDNPLEWFKQYNVRYYPGYRAYLQKESARLSAEKVALEKEPNTTGLPEEKATAATKAIDKINTALISIKTELETWSPENFDKLSQRYKNLHQKAFTTNVGDPDYRTLDCIRYREGDAVNEESAPKGDVLYQFRKDVGEGLLPAVSWLVAPENFSDHPSGPWYGAWYVSEVMDILTQKPEVWKKTIFILCYDENDGYFDHVPPYAVPNPFKDDTGATSKGITPAVEFVTTSRESPIGLGFRVPLIIASPWSRGGNVCSQVFDHTSIIQFLEKFFQHKTGKSITEDNISAWRRTICGDLTATFRPYGGEKIKLPVFVERGAFMEGIHNAQYRKLPDGYKALNEAQIKEANAGERTSLNMPVQEKGVRPACPLPYELYADGNLDTINNTFNITMLAGNTLFNTGAAGSPFKIYAPGKYRGVQTRIWNYAVATGDTLQDKWPLQDFEGGRYHLCVYGPNGFFREFLGGADSPDITVNCAYELNRSGQATGNIMLHLENRDRLTRKLTITDNAYKQEKQFAMLGAAGSASSSATIILGLQTSYNWYDFTVSSNTDTGFGKTFAGHVETGRQSSSDPQMGGLV